MILRPGSLGLFSVLGVDWFVWGWCCDVGNPQIDLAFWRLQCMRRDCKLTHRVCKTLGQKSVWGFWFVRTDRWTMWGSASLPPTYTIHAVDYAVPATHLYDWGVQRWPRSSTLWLSVGVCGEVCVCMCTSGVVCTLLCHPTFEPLEQLPNFTSPESRTSSISH